MTYFALVEIIIKRLPLSQQADRARSSNQIADNEAFLRHSSINKLPADKLFFRQRLKLILSKVILLVISNFVTIWCANLTVGEIVNLVDIRSPMGVDGFVGGAAPLGGGKPIRRDIALPSSIRLRPVATEGVAGSLGQLDSAELRISLRNQALRAGSRCAAVVERNGIVNSIKRPMRIEHCITR